MVPDFSLRIQTMMRALNEFVIPSVPTENKLAREQANLVVGYLAIMADQCDYLMDYELSELREQCSLLQELLESAQGGPQTHAALRHAREMLGHGTAVAELDIPSQKDTVALVRALKGATDAVINASAEDGDPAFRDRVGKTIIKYAEPQLLRWRAWIRKAGFDPTPDLLPSVEEAVRSSTSTTDR